MTQTQAASTLESLFNHYQFDSFVKELKRLLPDFKQPTQAAREVALYLAPRVAHRDYERFVPCALCGIVSALQASTLAKEEDRARPVLQQMALAHFENRTWPVSIDSIAADKSGRREERVERLTVAIANRDFDKAFALLRGLVDDPDDARAARQASLLACSRDLFLQGHKFYYLTKMWQMSETMQWENAAVYLYPALHYLLKAPRDSRLSDAVEQLTSRDKSGISSFYNNKKDLTADEAGQLERQLLFGGREAAIAAVLGALKAGAAVERVVDAIELVAIQALINAHPGKWLLPMRAFVYVESVRALNELLSSEQRFLLAILAGALVNEASQASLERPARKQNRPWPDRVEKVWPADPFSIIRTGQNNSDVGAAIASALAILNMSEEKQKALFETLVRLTVKNDAQMCLGYDVALCCHAVANFKASSSPSRNLYILGLVYFITVCSKKYNFFNALGF